MIDTENCMFIIDIYDIIVIINIFILIILIPLSLSHIFIYDINLINYNT